MSKNGSTMKPQQAIEEYLSALLHPSAKRAPAKAETRAPERPLLADALADQLPEAQKQALQQTLLRSLPLQTPPVAEPAPAKPAPVAKPEVAAKPAAPKVVPVTTEAKQPVVAGGQQPVSAPAAAAVNHWLANGRPHWAQDRFECLLFSVAGLKLAVPLICLGGIHAVQSAEDLTPLPGMPDWLLGLMPTVHGNLRVVDTARWVMPERQISGYAQQMRYVIRISGSEWGLACDAVDKSFRVQPDDVRWRTERSKRPWLAGTLVDQMCAVLDMEALDQLLKESERRKRPR